MAEKKRANSRVVAKQALLLSALALAAWTAPMPAQGQSNPCGLNNNACQSLGFGGCCGGSCLCGPGYCECSCC